MDNYRNSNSTNTSNSRAFSYYPNQNANTNANNNINSNNNTNNNNTNVNNSNNANGNQKNKFNNQNNRNNNRRNKNKNNSNNTNQNNINTINNSNLPLSPSKNAINPYEYSSLDYQPGNTSYSPNRNFNKYNFNNNNNSNSNTNTDGNNSGNNSNNRKFRMNKKRPNYSYNNGYPSNESSYEIHERLNKSLNKERSPNSSFNEMNQKMPTSISLDNFDMMPPNFNRNKRSPKMPNSYSFMASNINPHHGYSNSTQNYTQNSETIVEQEAGEEEAEVKSRLEREEVEKMSEMFNKPPVDENSFYSTPLNHTLPVQYNVDPNMSPSKNESRVEESSENEEGITPIKYDDDKVLHAHLNFVKSNEIAVSSSSSSSSSSPENKNKSPDESQPLVTASEGESSFGLEPTIENTITNVAIETSFSNEIEKATSALGFQNISIKQYLDEKFSHNNQLTIKENENEAETSASLDTESNTDMSQKPADHSSTSYNTSTNSEEKHLTEDEAKTTFSSSSTNTTTTTEDSSASSGTTIESSTTSTNGTSTKTTSSSSLSSHASSTNASKQQQEHDRSTSSLEEPITTVTNEENEEESKMFTKLPLIPEIAQLTPTSLEATPFNYPPIMTHTNEKVTLVNIGDSMTNIDSCGSCTNLNDVNQAAPLDINYSTQTNYATSTHSDCSTSPCSSSVEQTKPDLDSSINTEVSALVNKIVLDAVSQAIKLSTCETVPNLKSESYIEIDINETLIDTMLKEKQIGEEEMAEKVVVINSEKETISFSPSSSGVANKVETAAQKCSSGEQQQILNTTELLNESNLSLNSASLKKNENAKKDPIVDCFSCTII